MDDGRRLRCAFAIIAVMIMILVPVGEGYAYNGSYSSGETELSASYSRLGILDGDDQPCSLNSALVRPYEATSHETTYMTKRTVSPHTPVTSATATITLSSLTSADGGYKTVTFTVKIKDGSTVIASDSQSASGKPPSPNTLNFTFNLTNYVKNQTNNLTVEVTGFTEHKTEHFTGSASISFTTTGGSTHTKSSSITPTSFDMNISTSTTSVATGSIGCVYDIVYTDPYKIDYQSSNGSDTSNVSVSFTLSGLKYNGVNSLQGPITVSLGAASRTHTIQSGNPEDVVTLTFTDIPLVGGHYTSVFSINAENTGGYTPTYGDSNPIKVTITVTHSNGSKAIYVSDP